MLTLFSSFWYCGIFFRMWDRSLMLAWGQGRCEVPTLGLGSRLRPCPCSAGRGVFLPSCPSDAGQPLPYPWSASCSHRMSSEAP